MATKTQEAQASSKKPKNSGALQAVQKDIRPFQAFIMKFNNDWAMNFASGLAYNLLMAIFPLILALVVILGLIVGNLDPAAYHNILNSIAGIFPSSTNAQTLLDAAFQQVKKAAGFVGAIAVILAIFNGSRLFIYIEGIFDIIYHVRPRQVLPQNLVAIGMLLLFIILLPILVFASTGPALVFSILKQTPLGQIPGSGFIFGLGGILGGLIVAYILFQSIYIIVPNQRISFRNSWRGSVAAAVLLQLYLTLFPLYVTHFLNGYGGQALGLIILLIFFYYFGVILFLGAEVNAFFSEGIVATPTDLVTLIHQMTSHFPTSEKDIKEQAAASHKDEESKRILPQNEYNSRKKPQVNSAATSVAAGGNAHEQEQSQDSKKDSKSKDQKTASQSSRVSTIVEAVTGTALAFIVELVRLRQRKK